MRRESGSGEIVSKPLQVVVIGLGSAGVMFIPMSVWLWPYGGEVMMFCWWLRRFFDPSGSMSDSDSPLFLVTTSITLRFVTRTFGTRFGRFPLLPIV